FRKLRVEYGVGDGPEVTLRADIGVERASFGNTLRIDLPVGIVGEEMRWPFRRVQPAKAFWRPAERIGPTQHRLDANQIFQRERRSEKPVRRKVGREIERGADA